MDTQIEMSWILHQFSKIIIVSFLEPLSSPTPSSWPDLWYQASIFSCRVSLIFKKKAVPYPHSIHDTIALISVLYQASYYSLRGAQQGETFYDFSLAEAYLALGTLKSR